MAVVPIHPLAGAWAISEVHSLTSLNNDKGNIDFALAKPGVVGYSPRIGVRSLINADGSFNPAIPNRALEIVRAHGKKLVIRIIFGKYTTNSVLNQGPTITSGGNIAPAPFNPGTGGPNAPLEALMDSVLRQAADWAEDKPEVEGFHMGWASLNYSEHYFGTEVQRLMPSQGEVSGLERSKVAYVAACKRVMSIAYAILQPRGMFVAFGQSGHGPINSTTITPGSTRITHELSLHALNLGGPHSPFILVNANGFGPGGEWGGALESAHDRDVFGKELNVGAQDIHPANGGPRSVQDWQTMERNLNAVDAGPANVIWVEWYTPQWRQYQVDDAARAAFDAYNVRFTEARMVDIPDDPCAEVKAQLDVALAEIAGLEAENSVLTSELVDANDRIDKAIAALRE